MTTETSRILPLLDAPATSDATETGGCGCGGCGCGSGADRTDVAEVVANPRAHDNVGTTRAYAVTGMTCGHCSGSVTSELTALDGVTNVHVDLVPDGTSTVTVTSDHPLDDAQVAAALEEAGGYELA